MESVSGLRAQLLEKDADLDRLRANLRREIEKKKEERSRHAWARILKERELVALGEERERLRKEGGRALYCRRHKCQFRCPSCSGGKSLRGNPEARRLRAQKAAAARWRGRETAT